MSDPRILKLAALLVHYSLDLQPGQQTSHRDWLVQLVAFAVQSDDHEIPNLLREIRVSQGKP